MNSSHMMYNFECYRRLQAVLSQVLEPRAEVEPLSTNVLCHAILDWCKAA